MFYFLNIFTNLKKYITKNMRKYVNIWKFVPKTRVIRFIVTILNINYKIIFLLTWDKYLDG